MNFFNFVRWRTSVNDQALLHSHLAQEKFLSSTTITFISMGRNEIINSIVFPTIFKPSNLFSNQSIIVGWKNNNFIQRITTFNNLKLTKVNANWSKSWSRISWLQGQPFPPFYHHFIHSVCRIGWLYFVNNVNKMDVRKKIEGNKENMRYSHLVTHPSSNPARQGLTWRDQALVLWL